MKLKSIAAAFALAFVATPAIVETAHADKPAVYLGAFQRVAVDGYDLTSYFAGTPVRGTAEFAATHAGVTYHFANAANRARFVASPQSFLPQYGGYCSWAVAQGYTAPGRAQHWRVVDGKLYLNYDASVQRKWQADIPGFIRSANANWPNVLKR